MKKILIFLVALFSFGINVKAASMCDYQEQMELTQKASNVKFEYELEERVDNSEQFPLRYTVMKITILNVTDELYAVLKNDYDNGKITFKSSDAKDGIITYEWYNLDKVVNFTLDVYSSDQTGCPNESYKTFYKTTPRFNEFSNRAICEEYKDFYLCQRFVTFDEIDEDEFLTQIQNYTSGKINEEGKTPTEEKKESKMLDFIKQYKWIIVGGVVAIGGITATTIIIKNKKKQRDLGL